jgi:hypothetical protein
LSIKKNIDTKRLVSQKTSADYLKEFQNIGSALNHNMSFEDWVAVYKKIVFWELELERSNDPGLEDIIASQKIEANQLFCKHIQENYTGWLNGSVNNPPVLSHTMVKHNVIPHLQKENTVVFLVVIDNLRYDQWKILQPAITEYFNVEKDDMYCGILPTTTEYARNALFAGLMPLDIQKQYPGLWAGKNDGGSKNQYEETFIKDQLSRKGIKLGCSYNKITNLGKGKKLVDDIPNLFGNGLNVIVYNFVDMLSHARTEMEVIKELAPNESAYRSITLSWFEHSPLFNAFQRIADIGKSKTDKKVKLLLTTDHGSIRVKDPSRLAGDKNTTTNLRYKEGKSLSYSGKDVFDIGNPEDIFLPKTNISSRYVFAKFDKYFVYPNNYNYYMNFYRNSIQHGGVSMEEMLIPAITLSIK